MSNQGSSGNSGTERAGTAPGPEGATYKQTIDPNGTNTAVPPHNPAASSLEMEDDDPSKIYDRDMERDKGKRV